MEEVVKETPEYRCMQSQFSVLYNESLQLKAQLDEARTLLHGTRSTHQRQVELIEVIVSFGQRCYQSQILKLKEWALMSYTKNLLPNNGGLAPGGALKTLCQAKMRCSSHPESFQPK